MGTSLPGHQWAIPTRNLFCVMNPNNVAKIITWHKGKNVVRNQKEIHGVKGKMIHVPLILSLVVCIIHDLEFGTFLNILHDIQKRYINKIYMRYDQYWWFTYNIYQLSCRHNRKQIWEIYYFYNFSRTWSVKSFMTSVRMIMSCRADKTSWMTRDHLVRHIIRQLVVGSIIIIIFNILLLGTCG